ncbi:MAG: hypothetical protein MI723_05200 [Caulobacterales bacterium]|nr:hypothetical protein [Caulobacterales bacterium]
MRESSPLGRLAFAVATGLAVLWAAAGLSAVLLGFFVQPSLMWPAIISLLPIALIAAAVILDRLRSAEDRHYSRNVHD